MGVEFRQAASTATLRARSRCRARFDCIFIGVGLGPMQTLGIPGEQLPGVIDALRFIDRLQDAARLSVSAGA